MEVYLVRHAAAFAPDPLNWPEDGERPLTPDGEKRFRRAATGLRELVPVVDLVLTSPMERARSTAAILTRRTKWPAAIECAALVGETAPDDVLAALQEHALVPRLALVGHRPNLNELASYLLCGETGKMNLPIKKGGVIALELPDGLQPGSAALLWSATPGILRRLA